MRIETSKRLGYFGLGVAALLLCAGGSISLGLGTTPGTARDGALAYTAENLALSTAQGRLQYRGAWAASTAYAANDVVLQGGILYLAGTAFTSAASFNASNWSALADGAGAATAVQTALNNAAPIASTPFTPVILCGGAAPSAATYTMQSGAAWKLGPEINFNLDIKWTAMTCAGAVTISGLTTAPAVFSPDFFFTGNGVSANSPYLNVGAAGLMSVFVSNSSTPSGTAGDALAGSTLASSGEIKLIGRYLVN